MMLLTHSGGQQQTRVGQLLQLASPFLLSVASLTISSFDAIKPIIAISAAFHVSIYNCIAACL